MEPFEQRFELAAAGGRGDGDGVGVHGLGRIPHAVAVGEARVPPAAPDKGGDRAWSESYERGKASVVRMAVEMTQDLPDSGTAGDEGYCEVLQGADGPVYFLHQGLLFIVHDLLGRWIEPGEVHWLVSASVGRFGEPALYRLRCVLPEPEIGPASWTVRRTAPGQF